jgi:hypothetical protein
VNEVGFEEFEGGCKELDQVSDILLGHLLNHLTLEVSTCRELYLHDCEVLVLIAFSVHDFESL